MIRSIRHTFRYALAGVIAILCVGALGQDTPAPRSDSDPRIKTLTKRAAESKAAHLTEITFPPTEPSPVFTRGLQDAMDKYTVLTGRVTEIQVIVGKREIATWYKLVVDELIARHPSEFIDFLLTSIPPNERPDDLVPAATNELLLFVPGGRTVIDGVSLVEKTPADKPLELNRSYLFFLDTSSLDQLARLSFGSAGVFSVENNDTLLAMTSRSHPIVNDIETKFAHSLHLVKQSMAVTK